MLNEAFKAPTHLHGYASLDESIWEWEGKHERLVHIERKPNPDGFKVFNIAVRITEIERPYCIYFYPDIGDTPLTVTQSLDIMLCEISKTKLAVTLDNWFGMYGHIMRTAEYDLTVAIKESQLTHVWNVFGTGLLKKQYRTVTNGVLIATIYNDKSMVKTISTHFKVTEDISTLPANSTTSIISLPARLTEDDAKRLSELSLAGIKVIDSAFGESTGGSKEDMCRRIARLPLNRLSINTTELEVSGETVLQFKSRISKLKKVQLVKLCKTYSIPEGIKKILLSV